MKKNPWDAFLDRALAAVGDPELQAPAAIDGGLVDRTSADRYLRIHVHASGGIGRVWLAHDRQLGRDVAVKELLPVQSEDSVARLRFLREARITSKLEHPGVVPIYELDQAPGVEAAPYYSMRFVHGENLFEATRAYHAALSQGGTDPRRFRELLQALVSVANTIAFAHSKGVAHRDLKGHNVVLGPFGEVLVLDWGLAKVFDGDFDSDPSVPSVPESNADDDATRDSDAAELTREGQMVGTPAYAAPEQAEGRQALIDARTDVYGLGAILYDILAGRAPFVAADGRALLRKVVSETPDPPRSVRADVPPELSAVCMKALSKRREDRYQTASEFAEEINRWLADEPVRACPESIGRRLSRWARRHRTAVRAAAMGLVLSVVGLAAALFFVDRERAAKTAALDESNRNYLVARKSVDRFLMETGRSPELKTAGLDPLRRRLLSAARDFYEQLKMQRDDRDLNREMAVADIRLAAVEAELGRRSAAVEQLERAAAGLRSLLLDAPDDDEASIVLGAALYDLAQHRLALNDAKAAKGLAEESMAVRAELRRRNPDDLDLADALALSHSCLGQGFEAESKFQDAVGEYESAVRIAREAFDRDPKRKGAAELLAMLSYNLGTARMRQGRLDDARRDLTESLSLWEAAAKDGELERPNQPANARLNLGAIAYHSHDAAEARRQFQLALAVLAPLLEKYPFRESYKDEYAGLLANLAAASEDGQDSWKWLEKSLEFQSARVARDPHVPRNVQLLAQAKINAAAALFDRKEFDKGLVHAKEAVDLLDGLADRKASLPDLDEFRIQAASNYAGLLSRTGKDREALESVRKKLHLEGRAKRGLHFMAAWLHARLGDYRKTVAILDGLAVADPVDIASRIETRACAWSLASAAVAKDDSLPSAERTAKAEQYAQYAMRDLRFAVDRKLFNSPDRIKSLKSDDADYAPLRSRKDFQAVVDELEAKK